MDCTDKIRTHLVPVTKTLACSYFEISMTFRSLRTLYIESVIIKMSSTVYGTGFFLFVVLHIRKKCRLTNIKNNMNNKMIWWIELIIYFVNYLCVIYALIYVDRINTYISRKYTSQCLFYTNNIHCVHLGSNYSGERNFQGFFDRLSRGKTP